MGRHRTARGCWRAATIGATLLAGAVLGVPTALGASTDSGHTYVESFADTSPAPLTLVETARINELRQLYCVPGPERGDPSAARALATARRLVAAGSHGRGLPHHGGVPGRTEGRAMAAAVAAMGAGKPDAALAFLLRAHQLAPRDATPVIDAAPLLTQANRPREALALLAQAAHLRVAHTHPFGLDWSAIIAADRGQAQVVAHQYGAAERTLSNVLRRDPLITEADQGLAVAYTCQNKRDKAMHLLSAGATRQTFSKGDYIGETVDGPSGYVNPAEVLDTSHGTQLTLPTFRYPTTMDEGRAQKLTWLSLGSAATSTQDSQISRQNQDQAALSAQLAKASAATRSRTEEIITAVQGAGQEPDLASQGDQAATLQRGLSQLQVRSYGQGGCIDAGLHSTWLADVRQYDSAERGFATAVYRRMTGLAANLRNPAAHQVAIDIADLQATMSLELILDAGQMIAEYDDICDPNHGNPGTENPQSGTTDTPASDACPTGLDAPNLYITLLVASLNITCETVTLELDYPQGLISGFLGGTHNFRTGSNTVYMGAEAGIRTPKVGGVGFDAGPSARAGVYATFGADGSVQDVGVRASSQVSLGIGTESGNGGAQYSVWGSGISYGFVGGLTTG